MATSALILGSGGVRGWAHLGVVQALLEAGFRPGIIVRCSIGAIIGAFLALPQIRKVFESCFVA